MIAVMIALLACSGGKDAEEQAQELRSRYLDATCRLYSDETCVSNAEGSCPITLSFDSHDECMQFFAFFGAGCDFEAAFAEDLDNAEACVEQLETWDCESEPICDEDGAIRLDEGPCAAVNEAIDRHCDSGTVTVTG